MNSTVSMMLFWAAAVAMLVVVFAWVLPTLLRRGVATAVLDRRELNIAVYRDQYQELERDFRNGLLNAAQFATARRELEGRLAHDALLTESGGGNEPGNASPDQRPVRPVWASSLAGLMAVLAFGLYLVVGEPGFVLQVAAAEEAELERQRRAQEALDRLAQQVDRVLVDLEQAVQSDPDDGIAWVYLANGYIARNDWAAAEQAYARAYALQPEVAAVLSGYAEAIAVNSGRNLEGRPIELVREALLLDPQEQKALELAGIHAYQNQEFTTASFHWNQALRQLPEGSPAYEELAAMVRSARLRGHVEAFGGAEMLMDPLAVIRGRVELAPDLVTAAAENAMVFLIVRTQGGGATLATLSTPVGQLPVDFVLDDSLISNPEHLLSNYESVTLIARVSEHGDARARPGDLEGILESVRVGSSNARLVIDTVRP